LEAAERVMAEAETDMVSVLPASCGLPEADSIEDPRALSLKREGRRLMRGRRPARPAVASFLMAESMMGP
jgi:hypothetical protein